MKKQKIHACIKCNPGKDVYVTWIVKKLAKLPQDLATVLESEFGYYYSKGEGQLLDFMNGGIGTTDILEKQWVGQVQSIITRITSTINKLHPIRRRLAIINEFSQMPLDTIEHVQCGHCYQLVHQVLAELDIEEEDWQTDLLYHFEEKEAESDESESNARQVSALEIRDYADKSLWNNELVREELFWTKFVETGEGDGYIPQNLFGHRDYQVEDAEEIDGPDPVLCWRFFKSTCKVCAYQVAPSKTRHCLACYYFLDVLNELVASTSPLECSGSSWNQVKRWPRNKIQ